MKIKNSGDIEPTDNRNEFDDKDYMEDSEKTLRSSKDTAKRM